ncbi:MAG: hypothetical protein AAFN74_05245 [Myxococcota bacterium]
MDRAPWYLSRKIIGAGLMTLSFFGAIFVRIGAPESVSSSVIETLALGVVGSWAAQAGGQAIQDTVQARAQPGAQG